MTIGSPDSLPNQLLLHEFDQVWEHERQMETQRTQYLAAYLAIAVAVIPIVKSITGITSVSLAERALITVCLFTLYSFIAAVVFIGVRRFNVVSSLYEQRMFRIRERVYGTQSQEINALLSVRASAHPVLKSHIFSASRSSEVVVIALWLTYMTGLAVAFARLVNAEPSQLQLLGGTLGVIFAVCLFLALMVSSYKGGGGWLTGSSSDKH